MLLVSQKSILWKKINYAGDGTAERLDSVLAAFIQTLSDKNSQQSDPAKYFSQAHFLYKKLLPDAAFPGTNTLIIVPDGLLCHLPFEALLTAPHEGNFANAPYLLRSKNLRYAWSATLLTLQNSDKPTAEKGLLQIAPFTERARDNLAVLPDSPHDVPEEIGFTLLKNEQASVGEFLEKSPRFGVLHLSTHANAGEGIEFYDRRLTLPEIYAQRFQASLVSLSACETGKGQFAKGEGGLSLARAFAYAGAQSLVASHWSANERSTAELFSNFYRNLENGLSKAEALRQAKLNYLASAELDARKAPFHWAAFTLTGADGSVDFEANNLKKWLLGIVGLFVLVVLFRRFYFFKTGKITPEL
jgi:CHAT domain-containing protein